MIRIKRLYTFVLGTFLPLLLATFSICLFILLMQFLWQYVNDMVGKGVSIGVLGELFFYASLSFTPMALPLAILLASLMTFGNLGEHLELLAMKASGISLIRIMKPLIYCSIVIAGVSFVFQNNIVPSAKTKMYTIVLSLRQKSPELDIPEGTFYKEITGYNVYVKHKDKVRGTLCDLMIYDYSKGFENAMVIVADSGKLKVSADKKYLVLTLYNGESFANMGTRKSRNMSEAIPYRRETFEFRSTLIAFDTNFNMADESIMGGRDLAKNINELTTFVDSVQHRQDSINRGNVTYFKRNIYTGTFKDMGRAFTEREVKKDSLFSRGFKEYFNHLNLDSKIRYLQQAKSRSEQAQSDYTMNMYMQSDTQKQLRSHAIQLSQKFSLALACLLFFFIGAPLGAIIRKGGLGMPVVLSVFLFIFYYIVDTFGLKMAKQGVWPIWEGVWLSTAVLAALGVFFTYKAVNDSTMMNPDAWKSALQKLIGKREMRNYTRKEVIMTPPDYPKDIAQLTEWDKQSEQYNKVHKKPPFYISFWKKGFDDPALDRLVETMETTIEELLNSDEVLIINKLMDYPVIQPLHGGFLNKPLMRGFCGIVFPIGIIIYLIAVLKQKQVNKDLITCRKVNNELKNMIYEIKHH
ncbi:MAG: LptF/LptG family permease [Candidatus Symbiothrix sp.]|jgi:lipopolysaccharide export system permease protein|nr:LptF/LptG family permease [Candidatus Symbiothrix sp.]